MTKRKDLKKRLMEDPEFREEHARADDEFALIEALVRARAAAKLTQTEFARRLGRARSAIARLEGGRVAYTVSAFALRTTGESRPASNDPQPGRATSVQPACTTSVGIAETSTVRSAIARS